MRVGSEQLVLPVDRRPRADVGTDLGSLVVGFWAAAERLVDIGGRLLPANVWFHFAADGSAALSVRYRDQDRANATTGTWSIVEGELLVAEFGSTVIGAPLSIDDDAEIVHWAGEVLYRLPHVPTEDPGLADLAQSSDLADLSDPSVEYEAG